jgi:hypothetical protein
MELSKHILINKLNKVSIPVKKMNGKSTRVWLGIKLIQEVDFDEE